jgi:hypothetical protein
MLKGEELGIPRMYGLSNIAIINGKPTCSAELMLALVKRDYGPGAIRVASSSAKECTVEYREPGWEGVSSYTWTIDDAKAANLINKEIWKQYPAAMLRARCISSVVRMAFPQCISGMYTPEELGAEVDVDDHGEVVIADRQPAKPTTVTEVQPDQPEPSGLAERSQLALIKVAGEKKGLTVEQIRALFGPGERMTYGQAVDAIAWLGEASSALLQHEANKRLSEQQTGAASAA